MKRGEIKRLLRKATRLRILAERATNLSRLPAPVQDGYCAAGRIDVMGRMEETATLQRMKSVPSVFAFAEKLNPKYQRPMWANQRYGAK